MGRTPRAEEKRAAARGRLHARKAQQKKRRLQAAAAAA
eukprot:COSAG01_NODE_14501_length_1446_cov_0.959169_1_plen_37_part_10